MFWIWLVCKALAIPNPEAIKKVNKFDYPKNLNPYYRGPKVRQAPSIFLLWKFFQHILDLQSNETVVLSFSTFFLWFSPSSLSLFCILGHWIYSEGESVLSTLTLILFFL